MYWHDKQNYTKLNFININYFIIMAFEFVNKTQKKDYQIVSDYVKDFKTFENKVVTAKEKFTSLGVRALCSKKVFSIFEGDVFLPLKEVNDDYFLATFYITAEMGKSIKTKKQLDELVEKNKISFVFCRKNKNEDVKTIKCCIGENTFSATDENLVAGL